MADTKISALPASTTPLAGTEVLPIVQSGATKQVSVANLTAGRALSATELTLSTGNLIIGTSGKGIDFSATPGTGTSELLSDYEEGTWTGTLAFDGGSTGMTYAANTGYYERVGKTVHVSIYVELTSKGSSTGLTTLSGLPFISANNSAAYAAVTIWASGISATGVLEGFVAINSQQVNLYTLSSLGTLAALQDTAFTNTSSFMINVSYRTV